MSKRHTDSTPDEKAPNSTTLSADEVLVEAARNGDTTAVRAGLEKLSPDTDSKTVSFDAVHEACKGNHDECLALLLPYVETTQMGFGMLLSECIHADHTACTEVLLQHWKSVCSNVAFVPHGQEDIKDRPCPAMWEDPAVFQVLIDAGADIETKDDMGRSPLHFACRSGALDVVKMLVRKGARVCVADDGGRTCFMFAAYHGHTETVRYLVDADRTALNLTNYIRDAQWSALFYAIHQNHADVVQVLIDAGADIEVKDQSGCSPLHLACLSGELELVKMLVKAGAGVCVTDNAGRTCFMFAAYHGHTETVRYLMDASHTALNLTNQKGEAQWSALFYAIHQNHADVVQVLIDAGADIEAKDERGCSPLHEACGSGELEIVKVLVKAGSGVSVTDNKGNACLNLAAQNGHTETVRYLLCLPEVDVNQSVNNSGLTSLNHAVSQKHSDVVQVLIDAGADVEANNMGLTPLHRACKCGALEIVQMLVEAGADVRVVDFHSTTTCLLFAAHYGRTETVRYLVGLREVDVNRRNRSGYTALKLARQKKHADVVQVLLEHGAEE